MSTPEDTGSAGDGTDSRGALARDVGLYTVARLLLLVVLAAVLYGISVLVGVSVPLVVLVLLALVLALPVSRLLLRSPRLRVDRGIAATTAARSAERERLRARLRGEDAPPGT